MPGRLALPDGTPAIPAKRGVVRRVIPGIQRGVHDSYESMAYLRTEADLRSASRGSARPASMVLLYGDEGGPARLLWGGGAPFPAGITPRGLAAACVSRPSAAMPAGGRRSESPDRSASRRARLRSRPQPTRIRIRAASSGPRRESGRNGRLCCRMPASGGMPMAATPPIPVRELHDLFERHLRFDFAERHHSQYALIYRDATATRRRSGRAAPVGSALLRDHGGCRGRGVSPEPAAGVFPGRGVRLPQRTATRHRVLQSGGRGAGGFGAGVLRAGTTRSAGLWPASRGSAKPASAVLLYGDVGAALGSLGAVLRRSWVGSRQVGWLGYAFRGLRPRCRPEAGAPSRPTAPHRGAGGVTPCAVRSTRVPV